MSVSTAYNPPESPLKILHVDAFVIFLDKPAGLLSVPGKGAALADCLLSRLLCPYPEALLVHRLDRDTSGVMVFALSPHAQRHLGLQFEKRQIQKSYLAEIWGQLAEPEGRIDLPIGVDWPRRPRQMIDPENGRPAITRWQRLKEKALSTRVRLYPETGRSHQLRVHMKAIGHPIMGDALYAEGPAGEGERMMLHAESLKIRHPDGGKPLQVKSKAPF